MRRFTLSQYVDALYQLRNQATHGGELKPKSKLTVNSMLQENSELYVALMQAILSLRCKPDWKAIELESPGAS
jgi:hypothetical protein